MMAPLKLTTTNSKLEKAFSALFKQSDYKQALSDSLEAIKIGVHQFNETAMRCMMHVVRNVDQGVAQVHREAKDGFQQS
jgi:hypothetical protein